MSALEHTHADAQHELAQDIASDQARAEAVAMARRRRAAWHDFVIRMISLAIFLSLWQVAAIPRVSEFVPKARTH